MGEMCRTRCYRVPGCLRLCRVVCDLQTGRIWFRSIETCYSGFNCQVMHVFLYSLIIVIFVFFLDVTEIRSQAVMCFIFILDFETFGIMFLRSATKYPLLCLMNSCYLLMFRSIDLKKLISGAADFSAAKINISYLQSVILFLLKFFSSIA